MLYHSIFYCNTDEFTNLTISGSSIYSNEKYIYTLINFPLLNNIIEPLLIKNSSSIESYINIKNTSELYNDSLNLENICKYFKCDYNQEINYNYIKTRILDNIDTTFLTSTQQTIDILNKNLLNLNNIYLNIKEKIFSNAFYDKTVLKSVILLGNITNYTNNINYISINSAKIQGIINKTIKLKNDDILAINLNSLQKLNITKKTTFLNNIKNILKIFILDKKNIIDYELLYNIIKYSNYKKLYYNQDLFNYYISNNIISNIQPKLIISKNIEIKLNYIELSYYIDNNNTNFNINNFKKYGFNILALIKYAGIYININDSSPLCGKCSISYDNITKFNQCILGCDHIFSSKELIYNMLNQIVCPLCRNKIINLCFTRHSIKKISSKLEYIIDKINTHDNGLLFTNEINYNLYNDIANNLELKLKLYFLGDNNQMDVDSLYIYEGETNEINIFNNVNIEYIKKIFFMKNIS